MGNEQETALAVEPKVEHFHPSGAFYILSHSPHQWRHRQDSGFTPNRAMDGGSALHSFLLGGAKVVEIKSKDYRTKAAKTARDEARAAGEIPLLEHEYPEFIEAARMAAEKLSSQHDISTLVKEEQILYVREDGVHVSATPDALDLEKREVIEVKRTGSLQRFDSVVRDKGYRVQAAAYVEAAETKYGGIWTHKFLVCQETEPYYSVFRWIDDSGMCLGRSQWERSCATFKECTETGKWPGPLDGFIETKPWEIEG